MRSLTSDDPNDRISPGIDFGVFWSVLAYFGTDLFITVDFNPRRTYRFSTYAPGEGGWGGVRLPPLAVWPLIELELRGKNERVGVTRRSE